MRISCLMSHTRENGTIGRNDKTLAKMVLSNTGIIYILFYLSVSTATYETAPAGRQYQVFELDNDNGQILITVEVSPRILKLPISLLTQNGKSYIQRHDGCHMTGRIKDFPDSYVSLETCNGISGFIIKGSIVHTVNYGKVRVTQDLRLILNSTSFMSCDENSRRDEQMKDQVEEIQFFKIHRRSVDERLIVEMYLVMDNELFSATGIDRDETKAVQYIEKVVRHTDEIFSALNVRVILVGIEIWNAPEPAVNASDASLLLSQFLEFSTNTLRQRAPINYDFAALISAKSFGNNRVGLAPVDAMCGLRSGCIVKDWGSGLTRELQAASVLAHEIGHVFGMLHDDAACYCNASSCVMDESAAQVPTKFSDCSANIVKKVREEGSAPCLYNVPNVVYNGPLCGNGIKEEGEVCDCGTTQQCRNSKCCTDMCQLKGGAKCDSGKCCQDCQVVKANKLCRKAQNECDIEDVCDGKSGECPPNLFKQDMTTCGNDTFEGYCYSGQCKNSFLQCQTIWGSTGVPAQQMCYSINKRGTSVGNCGSITDTTYQACNDSNIECGILFCNSPNRFPEYGGGEQSVSVTTYFIPGIGTVVCKGTTIDLGPDVPNPGLVDDGTPCMRNGALGIKGVCVNRVCRDISSLNIDNCPSDNNGTACYGNGVCNNLAKCSCFDGFTGHNCANPVTTKPPHLEVLHIILIAVSGVLVVTGVVVFIIIRKKAKVSGTNNMDQKKTAE